MIKNYISISFLAFICAFSINELSAQEKSVTKKVVVIEKSIDKDGNVVQKKIVKEGEEADEYIKEMENEEKNVFIFKSDEDVESSVKVVKKQAYKIKTVDEEGNEKVVEWNGEGEMPSEIKEMMEKEGLHAKDHHESTGKIWIKKSINGEDTEIEVDIEDGELSEDMIKLLKEEDIEIEMGSDSNKAQLGVFIEDNEEGVLVTELIPDSAAEEGGILEGDIITKLDDRKITSMEMLMEVMGSYKPGEKTRVGLIRDGKKTYKDLVLKKAKNNIFKVRAHGDEDHMIKVFEVEEDVIIEKKK